jgi:alpha-N-arabinofuranosidase
LFQQNTLRDAVVAALNFNIFHDHAARVQMTNIAQMVNVLQAMIITDKRRMLLTPTYYAYQMYVPFQDATTLPAVVTGDTPYTLGATSIPGISVSAARAKDGKVYLALVNTHPGQSADVAVDLGGQRIAGALGQVLTAAAMDAHNTFEQAGVVKPVPFAGKAVDGKLTLSVPAKAVMVVALETAP